MEERLKILFAAGVLNDQVYHGMLKVCDKLEQQWKLDIRHNQGEILITHMANALMRAINGELIQAIDTELLAEIQQSEMFGYIQTIHQDLLDIFTIAVPDSEQGYLLANLYALCLAQAEL